MSLESETVVLITLKSDFRLFPFVPKGLVAPVAQELDDCGQKTEAKSLSIILENTVMEGPRLSSQLVQNV